MISNERPSPFGQRPYGQPAYGHSPYGQPKPPVQEDTLKSEKIQIERKSFVFTLKENPRGRFLRITEDVGGRRDTIIIPAPGLEDFKKLLDDMVKASAEIPTDLRKRKSEVQKTGSSSMRKTLAPSGSVMPPPPGSRESPAA